MFHVVCQYFAPRLEALEQWNSTEKDCQLKLFFHSMFTFAQSTPEVQVIF